MKNAVAGMFSGVGILIMCSFGIAGVIAGNTLALFSSNHGFNWFIAFLIIASGAIVGLLFFGISEALELLQKNADLSEAILKNAGGTMENETEGKVVEWP